MFIIPLQHNSDRATSQSHVTCRQSSKHFHVLSIKSYSLIPYSGFYRLPSPTGLNTFMSFDVTLLTCFQSLLCWSILYAQTSLAARLSHEKRERVWWVVTKLTQLHVVTSEVQRLICTGSLRMRSTAYAQLHTLNCMLQKAVLSALVVCCGLLAKWFRVKVRVRVRVRAGARECTSCTFFSLWFICVVNTSFVGSVYSLRKCARRVTGGYSIDVVTAWSWVNLATPESGDTRILSWCFTVSKSVGN